MAGIVGCCTSSQTLVLLRRVVVVDSIAALVRNETERHVADQQQLLGDIWRVPRQLAAPLLLPTACWGHDCCACLHGAIVHQMPTVTT